MSYYHYRVTAPWSLIQTGLINDFLNKFKPSLYVFSEEVSDKGVVHVHGHLLYDSKIPPTSTVSDLHKRYLLSGKYYHVPLREEHRKNLLYVVKDLDVKHHNMEEDAYNEIIKTTEQINADKKKNTRDKLFERFKAWFDINRPLCQFKTKIINDFGDEIEEDNDNVCHFNTFINDLTTIALFINDLYVNEWKKEPPLAHLNGYVLYIATLMNNEVKHLNSNATSQYYDVHGFYKRRF